MSGRAVVTIAGDVVLKRHAPGSDAALLAAQLAVAGAEPWSTVLLAPLAPSPVAAPSGDLLTLWPRVAALAPGDPDLPWAEAGEILARLHTLPVPPLQPHGGAARLARALRAAAALPADAAALLRPLASELLRRWPAPTASDRLVHGDFHLGQLGRTPTGALVLFDLDDLGLGHPAWDLGRLAGFHAAGILPDRDWAAFVAGYTRGGGRWPAGGAGSPLDHAARAAVVIGAVREASGHSDDTAGALLAACARMAQWRL
nr:phosphotransferase [Propionibacterium sp.]